MDPDHRYPDVQPPMTHTEWTLCSKCRNSLSAGRVAIRTFSSLRSRRTVLGLKATREQKIRGDVGLLRGDAGQTYECVYWHNKSSGAISDVPIEAMLTPQLWGEWKLVGS